jgi:hypothetical protein
MKFAMQHVFAGLLALSGMKGYYVRGNEGTLEAGSFCL